MYSYIEKYTRAQAVYIVVAADNTRRCIAHTNIYIYVVQLAFPYIRLSRRAFIRCTELAHTHDDDETRETHCARRIYGHTDTRRLIWLTASPVLFSNLISFHSLDSPSCFLRENTFQSAILKQVLNYRKSFFSK